MKKFVSWSIIYFACTGLITAQHWLPLDTTLRQNGWGHKLYNDTADDKLYLFGSFTDIAAIQTRNIASYDGNAWDSVGGGSNSEAGAMVEAMIRFENYMIAGGIFCAMSTHFCSDTNAVRANNIAAWDGQQWHPLGSGVNALVSCLMVYEDHLYVGGGFDSAGGNPANGLARWDGLEWQSLGVPNYSPTSGNNNWFKAMAMYKGELYLGGNFDAFPGIQDIVRWDGQEWHDVGGGLHGTMGEILDMVVYKGELYVGGTFTLQDDTANPGNNIARWDGEHWKSVGEGMLGENGNPGTNARVWDLHVLHDKLYATGLFQYASDIPAPFVASWDGNRWCSMYSHIFGLGFGWPSYMTDRHDTLLVVGNFSGIVPDVQGDSTRLELIAQYVGGDEACGQVYTTGIQESAKEDIAVSLSPNPASDILNVNITTELTFTASISDLQGRRIREGIRITSPTAIPVQDLSPGMYILYYTTADGHYGTQKFLKQ